MATDGGWADRSMMNSIDSRLAGFDFLQLVRVLLRTETTDQSRRDVDSAIRFRAELGASFPARNATQIELVSAEPAMPGTGRLTNDLEAVSKRIQITTPDFCIGSVLGPLPSAFLEWVRDLERDGKPGMREFLDIFNHRLNVLRYLVREQFELGLNNHIPERTTLSKWLASLMGFSNQDIASQIPLRARNWLGIGELQANSRRSAASVQQVLAAYLDRAVHLVPFTPQWRELGRENEHRLGQRRLGQDTFLGQRYWDIQAAVTLQVAPMDYRTMLSLLPANAARPRNAALSDRKTARDLLRGWHQHYRASEVQAPDRRTSSYESLAAIIHLMLDRRHDAYVRLSVLDATIPPSFLGGKDPMTRTELRLGQTAWLKSGEPSTSDAPSRASGARVVKLHLRARAPEAVR
jgi:type VI secretion system protein ImpH